MANTALDARIAPAMINVSFKTDSDKIRLLSEIGRIHPVLTPEDIIEYSDKYDDFKRNYSVMKSCSFEIDDWADRRYDIIKIPSWTYSMKDKKFYVNLLQLIKWYLKLTDVFEKYDVLKAFSSLRTHLYIEGQYYRPFYDRFEFEYFLSYSLGLMMSLESKILNDKFGEITDEEIELLIRAIATPADMGVVDDEVSNSATGILDQIRNRELA